MKRETSISSSPWTCIDALIEGIEGDGADRTGNGDEGWITAPSLWRRA